MPIAAVTHSPDAVVSPRMTCFWKIIVPAPVNYTTTPASNSENGYGSFFWLNRGKELPDVPEDMYYCKGHDGQRIFVIPSKDLVVVILGYSPKDNAIDFNALLKDIIDNL